ncbi:MAG: hypothetical protein KA791_15745 [Flavobacteriales bacterium]|nr:hypothetical protein [Flavobacteriales bacterium]
MRLLPLPFLLCVSLLPGRATAQSIAPDGTVSAGGHGTGATAMLSWSLGQVSGAQFTGGTHIITAGIQQPEVVRVRLSASILLGGPYNTVSALMNDGLRTASLLPASEPYTAAGFVQHGEGGGEQVSPATLAVSGSNAIVDWVFVELRSASLPQQVLSTRCALVQRDGDVVDTDGTSPLLLSAVPGNYHVAVRHRNHLPVMTLNPVALGTTTTTLNFIDGSATTYGTEAQRLNGAVRHLWPGDATVNHQVKYTGSGNDRDPILIAVGSTTPNNTLANQYNPKDVNMDGSVKYTGTNNDRDPILVTVGSTTPNNVRPAQLP